MRLHRESNSSTSPLAPPACARSWTPTPCPPTLRAAAGTTERSQSDGIEHGAVSLGPVREDHFAVRVSGDSMNGGQRPLRDGTGWSCAGAASGLDELVGRVALFAVGDPVEGPSYHLKRLARSGGRPHAALGQPARA
ncbi:MAG: hypothetical protein H6741_28640 [Alphaproteobacteria bacterium]|nr:hypothetical protein [Alphaproteobacteria bacterium]